MAIVLPGIESQSFLNHAVAWGLDDGGWPGAIELDDWTTGCTFLFAYHLRGWKRNQRQADRLAQRIVSYQQEFPGRPVWVIGHSGGGAMTVLALRRLPISNRVTGAVLLAPAISRDYQLTVALEGTERGIWHFWSPWDFLFLGVGTLALGTLDGRYQISAGMLGFRQPAGHDAESQKIYEQKLHQVRFSWEMARAFNLGGHFGCVNRVFVTEYLAPLLVNSNLVKTTEG